MYEGSIFERWNNEDYLQAYVDYCEPDDDYWIPEKVWDIIPETVKMDVVMAYCEANEESLNEKYAESGEKEWEPDDEV